VSREQIGSRAASKRESAPWQWDRIVGRGELILGGGVGIRKSAKYAEVNFNGRSGEEAHQSYMGGSLISGGRVRPGVAHLHAEDKRSRKIGEKVIPLRGREDISRQRRPFQKITGLRNDVGVDIFCRERRVSCIQARPVKEEK